MLLLLPSHRGSHPSNFMKQLAPLLILLLVIAGSCGNPAATQEEKTTANIKEGDEGTAGDFYMRLSGTLGGKPIVANLHKYGPKLGGYYEMAGTNRPVKLVSYQDTTLADRNYYLTEINDEGQAQQGIAAHWLITVDSNTVTGKWISIDGKMTADIALKTAYPDGSISLIVQYLADTGRLWKTLPEPKANIAIGIVWPHKDDRSESAAFLRSAIASNMNLEVAAGSSYQSLKTKAWRYFGNYRLDMKKVLDSTAKEETRKSFGYHYASTSYHYILYNDQHWLILEHAASNYTGGAHDTYGMSYLNLDLAASKAWTLHDIIPDTSSLQPLINAAARARFGLAEGSALDARLLVNEVPVTTNFYLNAGGLTFVYNPYDIASYADGVITLFIPYNKLLPLLTPDFKKRAGLGEQSGSL